MLRSFKILGLTLGGVLGSALLLAASGRAQTPNGIRVCSPDEYRVTGGLPDRLKRGAAVPAFAIITENLQSWCRVDVRVEIELRSRGHRLTRVAGNPATARVVKVVHPWSEVVHAWAWRNWCGSHAHWVLAVFSIPGAEPERQRVFRLPRCRNPKRRSSIVSLGTARSSRMLPKEPGLVFPAHFVPKSVPPIPSPALIRVQNRWLVGDGRQITDVYAGEAGDDPSVGIFVIYKTDEPFGYQDWHSVFVPGTTGAVRISQAPLGKKVETSAQRAKLRFVSKSGATGTLNLDGDVVTLDD
jgi:hypothetical protein